MKKQLGWKFKKKFKKQLFIRSYRPDPEDKSVCLVYEYDKPVLLLKYWTWFKNEEIIVNAKYKYMRTKAIKKNSLWDLYRYVSGTGHQL